MDQKQKPVLILQFKPHFALVFLCMFGFLASSLSSWAAGINLDSLRNEIKLAEPGDPKLKAMSDVVKYTLYNQQDTAWVYAEKFLKYANEIEYQEEIARGHNLLGLVAYVRGDHVLAIEKYLNSLALYEKLGENQMQGILMNNIAGLYLNRGDIDNTIAYYEKAYTVFEDIQDTLWMANVNYNLANQYLNKKWTVKADSLYKECLGLFELIEDTQYQAYALQGMANIRLQNKQFAEALELMLRASILADCTLDPGFCSGLEGTLCSCYLETNLMREAQIHCANAMRLAESSGVIERQKDASMHQRDYFKLIGKSDSALFYAEKLAVIRDSIWNQEKDQVVLDMLAKYESEKKEQQIEMQEMQLGTANRRNVIFGLTALIAAILLVGAAVLIRQKNRSEQKLQAKNRIINEQLAEKEVLIKEVHHRVKNNLQVVSSLLSIQSREIKDEAALEAVNASRNRVKSMALIHQNLYKQDSLRNVNAAAYIENLCESIFASYHIDKTRIKLEMDVDDVDLDLDITIPLGLIFNELISNSLKYAFDEGSEGLISICLKKNENALHICVKDNGKGIDPLIAKQKEGSFGMKLIDAFAKKLKAEWEIINKNGTEFKLDIANYKFNAP